MKRKRHFWLLVGAASFTLCPIARVQAAGSDEDLALVKKALQKSPAAEAPKVSEKPRWIHIRVEGKGKEKERVSVNLPFSLVEALGEKSFTCHGRDGKEKVFALAEILKTLETGQHIVEVEDEEHSVKVWVD
jgi:hypothetical protein